MNATSFAMPMSVPPKKSTKLSDIIGLTNDNNAVKQNKNNQ